MSGQQLCKQAKKSSASKSTDSDSSQINNLHEPDDAANTFQDAFKAYRKTDPQDAARVGTNARD